MKYNFVFLFVMLFPYLAFANLDSITWKGIYYQAIPNRSGVTESYCEEHTLGTFIHVVKDALVHPIITNKGIKLDHASFNMDKIDGVYLIHGSFLATGMQWQDRIYYYLYKYSEAGITKGIWYSKDCKGLYKGIAIENRNHKLS
ncbi:hypothetical protein [Legionella gresilensis]|uniref:hypothetical protein n=1 Tax=Legionella gresilensis TaxID=91823 RepID=UPI0010410089|nr:hypothetical protein [Legionella gresilensis]